MRWLYSLLLYLILPFALLYFTWRGLREPGYFSGWGQRLGFGGKPPQSGIWIHAASVGEVQAAVPLVKALAERYPDMALTVTTFTPTGRQRARKAMPESIYIQFLPLDLPHAIWLFLRRLRPRLGIIIETELWPNLLHGCGRNKVPVLLANASISTRSAQSYQQWPLRSLIRPAVNQITQIAAASDADAQAFHQLGVANDRIANTGNLKFDLELPPGLEVEGERLRDQWQVGNRPVWIAASTHPGEESIVLDALRILHKTHPNALLVLVPRHPQHFAGVAVLCNERGFKTAVRSKKQQVDAQTQIMLGDTLGELTLLYATADVALVGGSLVRGIGGHNLLEPAAMRLPIVIGKHAYDWADVASWLQAEAALCQVADAPTLAAAIAECLEDDIGRKLAGIAAVRVVEEHGGTLERTLRLIPALLTSG